MTFTRREFIASLGAGAAALAADAYWVEPNRLDLTRHVLGAGPAGDTASGRARLRLVQISDLHIQRVGYHETRVAEAVAALEPDVLLFTGDSVDRRQRLPEFIEFLKLLDPRTPGYAILGNWEHWSEIAVSRLRDVYGERGIQLLVNQSAIHQYGGREVLFTGLDDLVAGSPDLAGALHGVDAPSQQVLLMHCPAFRDRLGALTAPPPAWFRPQYMFSGHTHGGQVTFFGVPAFLPRGSGRYLRGWYRDPGGPALYVSRGVGMSGLPIRFWAPPEVASFDLFLADPAPSDRAITT